MTYINNMQKMFYRDRIGTIYGCFEVMDIEYDSKQKRQKWTLRCIHCGMTKVTYNGKDYVKGKNHGICVCQHTKKLYSPKPKKNKKAKMEEHPLYSRWEGMKSRCYRKTDKDYLNYGGRGITMCNDWRYDFWSFVDWSMENGYRSDLTIDRIDNNKGYSPDNCRWISRYEQNQNKRNVKLYDGTTLPDWCMEHDVNYRFMVRAMRNGSTLEEAFRVAAEMQRDDDFRNVCRNFGVDPVTIRHRMEKGLTFQQALDYRGRVGKQAYILNGVQKPLSEWCEEYGITVQAVMYRMRKKGMNFETAITTPKTSGKQQF